MSDQLLTEVSRFLDEFESTQDEYVSLLSNKRGAMESSNVDQLRELTLAEQELMGRLQQLLGRRKKILQAANTMGIAAGTIGELVLETTGRDSALIQRITSAESRVKNLRQESWVHWIVANRVQSHCSEVLEIIARNGKRSATYEKNQPHHGGAILDASA